MSNENKNNKNSLLYIIITLLIILIGIGGILIYRSYGDNNVIQDNGNGDNNNDENNKVENNGSSKDENLENKSDLVELSSEAIEFYGYDNLYKNIYPFNYELGGFEELGYYYHNFDYRNVESMDDYFKIYLTASLFTKYDNRDLYSIYENDNYDHVVPKKVFEAEYKKLFGNDKVNFDVLKNNSYQTCPGIFSDEFYGLKLNDEIYIAEQCGGTGFPEILTDVVKYEKTNDDNDLYIYEIVGYIKYSGEIGDENYGELFDVYSDENKNNIIDSEIEIDPFKYNLLTVKDKLSMYKYTFKYNSNGDDIENYEDYYFYSVEKVK